MYSSSFICVRGESAECYKVWNNEKHSVMEFLVEDPKCSATVYV